MSHPVEVLVLADTHVRADRRRDLPAEVWDAADRAHLILHAGDVVTGSLLDDLAARAPLRAVLGNNDAGLEHRLPVEDRVDLDGFYFYSETSMRNSLNDYNSQGEAAPETEFFSQKQVKALFRQFSSVQCALENIDDYIVQFKPPLIITNNRLKRNKHGNVLPLHLIQRDKALLTWGKTMGLDIYIEAYK